MIKSLMRVIMNFFSSRFGSRSVKKILEDTRKKIGNPEKSVPATPTRMSPTTPKTTPVKPPVSSLYGNRPTIHLPYCDGAKTRADKIPSKEVNGGFPPL